MTRRRGLLLLVVGFGATAALVAVLLRSLAAQRGGNGVTVVGFDWAIGAGALAGACVGWLLLATFLQLLLELVPLGRRLRAVGDAIAPASIRTIGRSVASAAATVSLAVAPVGGPPAGSIDAPSEQVDPDRARLTPIPSERPTAHLEPLVDVTPPTTTAPGAPAPTPEPPVAAPIAEVTVAAGEDFWRIADAAVETWLGRPPSDREVATYWLRLIDANRDRLVVPGNPNLLYPGQLLRVPPVDAPGASAAALPETR